MKIFTVTPNSSLDLVLKKLGGEHDPKIHWRSRHPSIRRDSAVFPETGKREVSLFDLVSSFKRANQRAPHLVVNSPDEVSALMYPMGWRPVGVATLLGFILENQDFITQIERRGVAFPNIWACGSFTRLPRTLPNKTEEKKVKKNWGTSFGRDESCLIGCAAGISQPRLIVKSLRGEISLVNNLFLAERI